METSLCVCACLFLLYVYLCTSALYESGFLWLQQEILLVSSIFIKGRNQQQCPWSSSGHSTVRKKVSNSSRVCVCDRESVCVQSTLLLA